MATSQANQESCTYNNANRWYQLFNDGQLTATYIYNAAGQRTRKVIGDDPATATITIYHYDPSGQLIAETDIAGVGLRDYIWHGMSPVAQIDSGSGADEIRYLHTDHLYTPRFATDESDQIVWRWEGDGFGSDQAEELGAVVNLRFLGQYYDRETTLHYNWNRYYDPNIGRYVTSDPIGLDGGFNTYGYVFGNPLKYGDPLGLAPCPPGMVPPGTPCRITSPGEQHDSPFSENWDTGDASLFHLVTMMA